MISIKPPISKDVLKVFRKTKWESAERIQAHLTSLDVNCVIFDKNNSTPHMRAENTDYWPSTQRFYDRDTKLWGAGESQFEAYVLRKKLGKQE